MLSAKYQELQPFSGEGHAMRLIHSRSPIHPGCRTSPWRARIGRAAAAALLTGAALLAVVPQGTAQTTSDQPAAAPGDAGTTFTRQFAFGNKQVPLPRGEWQLVGHALT